MAIIQKSFSDLVDFTRGSEATGWVNGQLKTFGVNEPRFVTDPAAGYSGLLLEPFASTNLVTHSLRPIEWAGTAGWDKTPIQNIDGTMTAVRAEATSTNLVYAPYLTLSITPHYTITQISRVPVLPGGIPAEYIAGSLRNVTKGVSAESGRYYPSTGEVTGSCVSGRHLGEGWYEVVFSVESPGPAEDGDSGRWYALGSGEISQTGTVIEIAGLQIESGDKATSFIPTEDSQATRAGDFFTLPTGDWYRPDRGTLLVRAAAPVGSTVATLGSIEIVSDSAEMKEYQVPYNSANAADDLVLSEGLINRVTYYQQVLP